jgi:hypothetical protein
MSRSIVRLASAAAGTLILLLLSAPNTEAGPARHKTHRSERTVCGVPSDARATATSRVRSFSRKSLFRTRPLVHRHVMAKLQRNQGRRLVDDDEAINPAVGGHAETVLLGALEPIGMLAVPLCQSTSHRTVSRRSPRGPPRSPA